MTAAVPRAQAPARVTVEAALDQYANRPEAGVARRVPAEDVMSFLRDYRSRANRWISRARPEDRVQRQRVAAGLAVELVARTMDGSLDEYRAGRPLVEWFCEMLRKQPPSEFERIAMLASVAALQGGRDVALLGFEGRTMSQKGHLDHAAARFPAERRFRLARLLERNELRVISTVALTPAEIQPDIEYRRTPEDVEMRLREILYLLTTMDDPRTRDEARLRRGVLQFVVGRTNDAVRDLGEVALSSSPFVAYVSNLLLGSIYYAGGDASAAAARYSRAVHAVPATSARLGLAASLVRLGETKEAALLAVPLPSAERVDDPWRIYGLGLFHELPNYLEAMRAALR